MWLLDPPGGYPGENSFFRETLGESGPGGTQNMCFLGIRQRFVARDRGQATGCDPMGVVEGPCGLPCRVGGYPWENSFFRETVGTSVGGGVL